MFQSDDERIRLLLDCPITCHEVGVNVIHDRAGYVRIFHQNMKEHRATTYKWLNIDDVFSILEILRE